MVAQKSIWFLIFCFFASCGPSDGPYFDYYPDGVTKEQGRYTGGLKTGEWRYFWKTGKLQVEGIYVRDKPHGEWRYYDEDGHLIANGVYRNGQMWDGKFVRYVIGTKKTIVVKEGQQVN
jgi:antitoxin component YwqK of YwqJK toxin-antitoxin module